MSGRRSWVAIVLLAVTLHILGMARSPLPAQDGLKFIRIARGFQNQPWGDVIRGSDQHPLYPALIAAVEPLVALATGPGPEAWRIAAQLVAACASVALLWPLRALARRLFDDTIASLTVLGFILLPLPMVVGHDTLSDSLALCAFLYSLWFGLMALGDGSWPAAIGCGFAAGVGFLARPEVLVAPVAVLAVGSGRTLWHAEQRRLLAPRLAGLSLAFLSMVGGYTLVKGDVSEKLALRSAAALAPSALTRKSPQWLPPGLDDPRWDFSPKEESDHPTSRGLGAVVVSLATHWFEGLGGVLALFAIWGLLRDRAARRLIAESGARPDGVARALVAVYLGLFTLVLARHEARMGYLSDRHVLTLVTLSLPWSAAGIALIAQRLSMRMNWTEPARRLARTALIGVVVAVGVMVQTKPAHASRWGQGEAGRWLAANARESEAVLDTRGWAAFVSGRRSYDYWHVRQAFTDSSLAYIVVTEAELKAGSRRAETLRAVLAHAGHPVASFPEHRDGKRPGVHIYRFERPTTWEGLRP